MAAQALANVEYTPPLAAANDCPSPRQFPEPRVNGSRLPATLHYNYETAPRARTQAAANDPQYGAAKGRALYEEYNPFGTTAYWSANSGIDVSRKRYRYIGKERDEETGLYQLGARYYASWLGRWTAADPIGLGDGVNRYAYSRGNPIRLSDPAGTSPLDLLPSRQEIAEFAHETAEAVEAAAEAAGSATFEALEGASPTGAAVAATAVETAGKFLGGAATIGVEIAGGTAEAPEHLEAGAKAISTGVETGNLERIVAGVGELATAAKPVFEALLVAAGGVKGGKPAASSRASAGEAGGSAGRGAPRPRGAPKAEARPTGQAAEAGGAAQRVARSKAAGDAARDSIAARFPGARTEVTLETSLGSRRLDVLTPEGLAIESKVGRTSLTKEIRRQLEKDIELLGDPTSPVRGLRVEFSRSPTTGKVGPTKPLEKFLRDRNVETVINR